MLSLGNLLTLQNLSRNLVSECPAVTYLAEGDKEIASCYQLRLSLFFWPNQEKECLHFIRDALSQSQLLSSVSLPEKKLKSNFPKAVWLVKEMAQSKKNERRHFGKWFVCAFFFPGLRECDWPSWCNIQGRTRTHHLRF